MQAMVKIETVLTRVVARCADDNHE